MVNPPTSTSKKESKKASGNVKSTFSISTFIITFVTQYWLVILSIIVVLMALLFGYSFSLNSVHIKNYVNANSEVLKEAIFHTKQPHLFYCIKQTKGSSNSKGDDAPRVFTDLYKVRKSTFKFAAINCSQILPSGKSIWERFHLKKEIKPTIFGSAPWAKVRQAMPEHMKDLDTMKKFVDNSFAPKATLVTTDKELRKICHSGQKNNTRDSIAIHSEETCIVFMKGSRHTKSHSDMEARLVKENPKLKIVIVDATKRRLSFENPEELPADLFGLKVHALRNMTHYLSMVNPVTWDYLSTFVGHAAGSPLEAYSGSIHEPISLLKLSSPVFTRKMKLSGTKKRKDLDREDNYENEDKDDDAEDDSKDSMNTKKPKLRPAHRKRQQQRHSSQSSHGNDGPGDGNVDNEDNDDARDRSKEGRAKRRQKAREDRNHARKRKNDKDDKDGKDDKEETSTLAEKVAERAEKERIRRENMDRQSRNRLFDEEEEEDDDDDDENENDSSNDNNHRNHPSNYKADDDDDEIIEL